MVIFKSNHLTSKHWFRGTFKIIKSSLCDECLAEKNMALTSKQKEKVTKEVKRHEKDNGSPEYQIALFSEKIKKLTTHLKKNKQDFHSRRGLLKMVAKRKKLMSYLKKTNEKVYKVIIKKLKLKG